MKKLLAVLVATFAVTSVYAADDCAAKAAEKKLAGAAKTSFMKKCTAESRCRRRKQLVKRLPKRRNMAGAAKNSFVKKCVADAGAAPAK